MFMTSINRNENGMVLIIALILLAVLALVGTIAVKATNTDIKISSNYNKSLQAVYIAEAGVGRAESVLKTNSFDKVLNGTHGGSPGILNFGTSTSFSGGTYTVRVFDDNDGDGNTLNDSNGKVKVVGTGTVSNGSAHTIESIVSKADLDDFPSAVSMVDPDVKLEFLSNALDITGNDKTYVPGPPEGTTPGTGFNKNGLATEDASPTETYSPSATQNNITGTGTSTPNINKGDTSLSLADLQTVRSELIAMPGITTYSGSTSINGGALGTRDSPQITYVNDSLTLSGVVTGVGILIVDKKLYVSGNLTFEGIILVGICPTCPGEFEAGTGNSQIFGAIVVANPTSSNSGEARLKITGNTDIYYSTFAIELALKATFAIDSWREVY